MKEEYLEMEGYEEYVSQTCEEEAVEENTSMAQSQQEQQQVKPEQRPEEMFPIQPTDFDGHADDVMLRKLLKKFQMTFLYPFFKAYDITYRCLRYLSVDDINQVIRSVGHRAEFREKLFTWRRKRYRTNDVIIEHEKVAPNPTTGQSNRKKETTISCTEAPNVQQRHGGGASVTNLQDLIMPVKNESSNFDSSPVHDMMNDLPIEIELEGVESKRSKLETIVDLRDTRLGALLNLEELVDESVFGPIMKAFYNKYGFLERKHRDELIQTIVDYVVMKEIKLHCSDFAKIVDMIVNIFPTEDEARDYYFINRKGKRNPMGRLYTKYYNTLKRLRVRDIHQEFPQEIPNTYMQSGSLADDTLLTTQPTTISSNATTSLTTTLIMRPTTNAINANDANNISNSNSCSSNSGVGAGGGVGVGVGSDGISSSNKQSSNTQIELIEDDFRELIQLDDTSVSAIKNFLHCTGLNWDDVKTMWSKTYLSRQEDVEHSTTKDILQQWPKYLNARGMELFDIDFRLKFSRNKTNILQRKWPYFVQKITYYYQTNIKDEMCKGFYALWKTKPGKDTEDYILTVLLNSIMIPMARYRDTVGNRRKVAIVEAVDLFAVRVTHLEELDQKREEFAIKFGDIHSEFTPLIVVVGDNNINIHEIYVHFDVALYEMPDFLSALDCCMKIYRVLNLPFPTSNEYVWTFIQRYFYEISLPDDIKCPSMSSLITFLKF